MKLCKDCKYYFRGIEYDFCNRKNMVAPDTVTLQSDLCDLERYYNKPLARLYGTCGYEGRFYEPKEAES